MEDLPLQIYGMEYHPVHTRHSVKRRRADLMRPGRDVRQKAGRLVRGRERRKTEAGLMRRRGRWKVA